MMSESYSYPKAQKVQALPNYCILVDYVNGESYIYSVLSDINHIKAFAKLKDKEEFSKVYLTRGGMSIAWGDGDEFSDPDMDVEVPFSEGQKVG